MSDLPPKNGLPSNGALPTAALSPEETEQLAKYEGTIRQGLKVFWQVGLALLAIRDSKLYRAEFKSFEAYCAARWDMGKSHAYRLMDAAEVIGNLNEANLQPLPANEKQTRELRYLPPADRAAVWQDVTS